MIVQISLSGNLFVFRKNPSLQPLQKNVFLSFPSCVFYRSKKVFLKKCFLEEKTSFISSWFLLHLYFEQKLWSIFQLSFFFAFVVLSLFFFFCSFFLVSVFPNKKRLNKFLSRKFEGFFYSKHFLLNFFWGRNIFWSKKECVQQLSFEFSSKNLP